MQWEVPAPLEQVLSIPELGDSDTLTLGMMSLGDGHAMLLPRGTFVDCMLACLPACIPACLLACLLSALRDSLQYHTTGYLRNGDESGCEEQSKGVVTRS